MNKREKNECPYQKHCSGHCTRIKILSIFSLTPYYAGTVIIKSFDQKSLSQDTVSLICEIIHEIFVQVNIK